MTYHTKIGPKHQITIPKAVFDRLRLAVGDLVEISEHKGKAMLMPTQIVHKAPTAKLSASNQKVLESAKRKIDAINRDLVHSKGLTRKEAWVAAEAGLIDLNQAYWWLEKWQKGERAAEKDYRAGRYEEYGSVKDFVDSLTP